MISELRQKLKAALDKNKDQLFKVIEDDRASLQTAARQGASADVAANAAPRLSLVVRATRLMIKLTKLTNAAILTGFFSLYSLAANASGLLCSDSEVEIWSCAKNEKYYSICASKNLGVEVGYMQYRAGRIGKTEFTFPSTKIHPKGKFTFGLLARGASISFKNGEFRYFINELLTMGETIINVDKNDEQISEIKCNYATYTLTNTTLQNHFKDIGIYE